jgi:hypothetical protein
MSSASRCWLALNRIMRAGDTGSPGLRRAMTLKMPERLSLDSRYPE